MKIEAGKYYRTRFGKKAYTSGFSPFSSTSEIHIISGWVNGSSTPTTWTSDGRMYRHGESENDLVAEWVDPISVDLTVRLIDRNGLKMVMIEPINHERVHFIGVGQKMPGDVCLGSVQTKLIEAPF
jgi:hypothetical protein